MTTQRDKVILIGINRWVIFILCSLALLGESLSQGTLTMWDVFGELGLMYWLWLPKVNQYELKLLERWRGG